VRFAASPSSEHPPLRLAHLDTYTPPASRAPEILAWRPLPMVGRQREQELVWATLREVAWGSPQGLVLEGPDTLGRPALASWVCSRAHEVGAADVLRADEGLPPVEAILSGLMEAPASLDAADAAVGALWPELEPSHRRALALAAFGAPSPSAPDALVRALQQPDARRVIVHLVGEGMVPLAEALLRSQAAVLVLLEVEALGTLSEELLDRSDCVALSLEPLDEGTLQTLCERMLPVSTALATALASRASGHPVLAAELLHRLVADHALSLAHGRWALTAGLQVPEPTSDDQLPPIVAREGAACLTALAGLAGLRRPVDDGVWAALCGIDPDDARALAKRLTAAGVLRWSPSGLALVRPQRKRALWRQARSEGLLDGALLRAAPHATNQALRGELLLEAGRPSEALPHLLQASRDDLRSAPGQATAAQRLLADAVRLGGLPTSHPQALQAALVRVEQLALADQLDEAEQLLARLPEPPEEARGDHARSRGLLAMRRGELSTAVEHLQTARSVDMDDGDAALYLGHALAGLSRAEGRYDDALDELDAARQEAEALGRPRAAAVAWMGLGDVHRHRGRFPEAADALAHAERLLDPRDPRWVLLRLNQAMLALARGDDDRAATCLDELDRLDDDPVGPDARRHLVLPRLVLAAGSDEDIFASWMQRAVDAIARGADPDHAHCLELAAQRALAAEVPERARRCLRGAQDLWDDLERPADRERVQRALGTLQREG
jgi:tetratricopeptide (TPR) repeat protein